MRCLVKGLHCKSFVAQAAGKGLHCKSFVTKAAGNNGVDLSEYMCRLICNLVPIFQDGKQAFLMTNRISCP